MMKSHFQFSSKQRNGIFILVVLIVLCQCIYFFIDFSDSPTIHISDDELKQYRAEVSAITDSLKRNTTPKVYHFNPNFITDYKGYTLGMSVEEIDRLHKFRQQNQWINSSKQFQEVTKVSDSLLNAIQPYFKFPKWVTNPRLKTQVNTYSTSTSPKSFVEKKDLNKASAKDLQNIYGVGQKLSKRIIKYRNKYAGGFIADAELTEVWGLKPEVILRITNEFTVKTPRSIVKLNLNLASRDELVTIPHIDYEIAKNIIEERTLQDGFLSIDDLTKVEQFPIKKIEIIKLYLYLK